MYLSPKIFGVHNAFSWRLSWTFHVSFYKKLVYKKKALSCLKKLRTFSQGHWRTGGRRGSTFPALEEWEQGGKSALLMLHTGIIFPHLLLTLVLL